jgi:predicted Zn-dependent protease with MMP-like domain
MNSALTHARRVDLAKREICRVMDELPPPLREAASQVAVLLFDRPDPSLIDQGFEPDLLGLFEGETVDASFAEGFNLPPQIILYLENIWDYAGGKLTDYLEEVRRTCLHELGHYLGMDEDDLAERDLD